MTTSSSQLFNAELRQFFTSLASEQALSSGFIKRCRILSGSLFLQSLVWTVYKSGIISNPSLAAMAEELDPDCKVSVQAFQKKFSPACVTFLKAMFVLALKSSLPAREVVLPIVSAFTAVYLLDSSQVSLPSCLKKEFRGCGGAASDAAVKVFLLLNFLTGRYESLELKDGRKADQNTGKDFLSKRPSGSLWLFDLGFFWMEFLVAIALAESYFLCRLQSQVKVRIKKCFGQIEEFDLDAFLGNTPRGNSFELEVCIGRKQNLESRLVCVPVCRAVSEEKTSQTQSQEVGEDSIKEVPGEDELESLHNQQS